MAACARIEAFSGSADERESDEAKALAELTEIKQQIDRLIAESNSRRSTITDTVVVGTIETGGASFDRTADNKAGVFRSGALASGPKLPWQSVVDWILRRCSVALKNVQGAKDGKRCRRQNKQK